jgi:gas vesicle protein
MFSRVRIAIRFFFVGLAVGVLLAPRSGEETRRMVREKADRILNDVLDAATLGTVDTSRTDEVPEEADAPRRASRSTNGGATTSRPRARTASTTSTGTASS